MMGDVLLNTTLKIRMNNGDAVNPPATDLFDEIKNPRGCPRGLIFKMREERFIRRPSSS
jgi:hypothetical protein